MGAFVQMMGMGIHIYTRIMKLELARLQTMTSHLKNVLPFVVHMLIIKDMLDLVLRCIATFSPIAINVFVSLMQASYLIQILIQLSIAIVCLLLGL